MFFEVFGADSSIALSMNNIIHYDSVLQKHFQRISASLRKLHGYQLATKHYHFVCSISLLSLNNRKIKEK